MKISVVIPHMIGIPGIDALLRKCVNSLVGADETIIVVNDGMGYGAACNLGLRMATGDFIVIANNDSWLASGTLRNLPSDSHVSVPAIVPEPRDRMPRAFFGITRFLYEHFYETYGDFYDERFEVGYWEDDDLIRRLQENNIQPAYVPSLIVHHLNGGGTTMKTLGEQKYFDENKERFLLKWNDEDNL